jgi:putative tryptophan/tyrosine transport system substrate-binding protein
MNRRKMIAALGGAATWPLAARAQQAERMRRIGVLMGFAESDRQGPAFVAAFRDELQKLGWVEGRNIRVDIRWAAGDTALMQRFAKELVALQPDLILSHLTPTTTALLQQTRIIPIVFALVADPIGSGFVASFARPGGNVTGFIFTEPTWPAGATPGAKPVTPPSMSRVSARRRGECPPRAIAAGLNERNIPTARGGEWSATQVARLLEDIERPFDVAA